MAAYGYTPAPVPVSPQRNGCWPACLGCLAALLIGCCLLSAALVVLWPMIRSTVSAQVGQIAVTSLNETAAANGLTGNPLGEMVAAVPPGEYTIDISQLRSALTAAGLPGADSVRFVRNRLVLPLDALGAPGSFSTEIGAADGRLIFIDPQIDGPIGALVDPAGLIEPLLLQVNEAIIAQERSIEQAFINGDRLVIVFR